MHIVERGLSSQLAKPVREKVYGRQNDRAHRILSFQTSEFCHTSDEFELDLCLQRGAAMSRSKKCCWSAGLDQKLHSKSLKVGIRRWQTDVFDLK
jgi:hypothetical protein